MGPPFKTGLEQKPSPRTNDPANQLRGHRHWSSKETQRMKRRKIFPGDTVNELRRNKGGRAGVASQKSERWGGFTLRGQREKTVGGQFAVPSGSRGWGRFD